MNNEEIIKGVDRKCCVECGFPISTLREPVFLNNNVLSIVIYEEHKCKTCGHQADGSTIPAVSKGFKWRRELWERRCREKVQKAREEGIKEGRKLAMDWLGLGKAKSLLTGLVKIELPDKLFKEFRDFGTWEGDKVIRNKEGELRIKSAGNNLKVTGGEIQKTRKSGNESPTATIHTIQYETLTPEIRLLLLEALDLPLYELRCQNCEEKTTYDKCGIMPPYKTDKKATIICDSILCVSWYVGIEKKELKKDRSEKDG